MNYLESISFKITPDIMALLILWFLLILVRRNEMISKEKTRFFIVTIYVMGVVAVLEIITILCEGSALIGIRRLHLTANVFELSITPLVPILMAITFNPKIVRKIQLLICPVIAYILFCIQSSYLGLIFNISAENSYSRGPLFLFNTAISIYTFCILLYSRRGIEAFSDMRERRYLNYVCFLIALGTFIDLVSNNFYILWCCESLALLFYYIYTRELELKYDMLTKFMNYKYFVAHLEERVQEKEITMVVLEVTKLNVINEQFGFLRGDHYIETAAKVIQDSFQKTGDIYRLSGGKFCVILNHTKEKAVINCLCHMKLKMKKYKTNEVPLSIISGYASCQLEEFGRDKNERKREIIRHCFYAAEQKLKEEKRIEQSNMEEIDVEEKL